MLPNCTATFFDYKTVRGHTRTLPNFTAFFISDFEGFCTLPECTAAFFNLRVSAQFLDYHTVRGLQPRWWLLFSPPKIDHFKYYYYAHITLLHSLRLRPLLLHTPQVTWRLSTNFFRLPDCKVEHYQTAGAFFPNLGGFCRFFWLPDCTGATTLMTGAFFPVEKRSFWII